ncbi:MAG: histidine phosphatase family protein [Sterolibacteriaceae bacterium]|jgi:phosphohistidine phosphatase|nr:histidine phosphatase family protein [Sterolibacteriaceae bacterium]MBK9085898.1 histidine phosphatase family protein [Sterolibacteriaceae bacterium]
MDLLLWRHAEAVDSLPDEQRELTTRGRRQAESIAEWLAERRPKDLRIIVSPAKRALQTARLFTREFEITPKVGTAADFQSLLSAAGWPEAGGAVLVVGHQPTLGRTASFLLTGQAADLSFKKGALWWISTRERGGVRQSVLKASITAELADGD